MAIAADGVATVVWARGLQVEVVRLNAAGVVAPPLAVSPADRQASSPSITLDGAGGAYVAWYSAAFSRSQTEAAYVSAAGTASTPWVLSADSTSIGDVHVTDVPGHGALAIWRRRYVEGPSSADWRHGIEARRLSSAGTVGTVMSLTPQAGDNAHVPVLGRHRAATTTVAWYAGPIGGPHTVQATRVDATGTVGAVTAIEPGALGGRANAVLTAADGTATIVTTDNTREIGVRRWSPDGTLVPAAGEPRSQIQPPGFNATEPAGTVAADGTATVVWRYSGSAPEIRGARIAPNGTVTPAPLLGSASPVGATPAVYTGPAVAGSSTGVVVAAWTRTDDTGAVETARYDAGPLVPPTVDPPVDPPSGEPQPPAGTAPPPFPAPPGSSGPPLDRVAPVVRGFSVRPGRLRSAGSKTRPITLRFGLDEPARVTLRVERQVSGRRAGPRCVAPTRTLIRRKARRCTRYRSVATVSRAGRAGSNRVTLTRLRVGGRKLGPGRYRVGIVAVDPAGNASARRSAGLVVRGR